MRNNQREGPTLELPRVWINREAVEELMKKRGIESIRQLADRYAGLGLGAAGTVYDIVDNKRDWRVGTWVNLAGLLGCHPFDIIATEGPLPKAHTLTRYANSRIVMALQPA